MWFNNECGVLVVELLLWQMPDMCGETPRLALCPRLLLVMIGYP